MSDREKIITAIEKAKKQSKEYAQDRIIVPFEEADMIISLLKEQEHGEPIAIKQEMFDEFYGAVACCPKCDCLWIMYMDKDMHYCPECGQAVKWDG